MDEEVTGATAGTPPATETAAVKPAQAAPEVTAASPGAPAESTPTATETELAEFKATVAEAIGNEKGSSTESKADGGDTKTDEPVAAKAEDDPEALSQESKDQDLAVKGPDGKAPVKLTERPEWQKLTAIADKVSPEAGKEVRAVLRQMFKGQHDLQVLVEKAKPAQEVVREMLQSVGGSEVGFGNMRKLITTFDRDPAGAVPMLERLLGDARQRAGLVLQSPEFVTEAKALDQQVADGSLTKEAADKRKAEMIEVERTRADNKRATQRTQTEEQQRKTQETQAKIQAQVASINQAEADWAAAKKKIDPDFELVADVHAAFAQQNSLDFWNTHKRLPSVTESTEILEKSLKQAKEKLARLRPTPKAKAALTTNGDGSSGNNRQTPQTELEEFKAEVEKATRRNRR